MVGRKDLRDGKDYGSKKESTGEEAGEEGSEEEGTREEEDCSEKEEVSAGKGSSVATL